MACKYNDSDVVHHNHRVLDVEENPHKKLFPIEGYAEKPLVSLEEAIEPLINIVDDIKNKVSIAKWKCAGTPANNLSQDQSASIILYSMEWEPREKSFYYILNSILRDADRKKLKPWFLYLKLFISALCRLPPYQNTVFRGVRKDLRSEYQKGETVWWWNFSSCTRTMDVLQNDDFLGSKGARTLFTIDCKTGRDIREHSAYDSENEVLLLAGRQFLVVAVLLQGPDLVIIQLQETEPRIALIELIPNTNTIQSSSAAVSQSTITPAKFTKDIIKPVAERDSNKTHGSGVDINDPAKKATSTKVSEGATKHFVQSYPNIPQASPVHIDTRAKNVSIKIPPDARWAQNGVTVAGGHGEGEETNQLHWPSGFYVDKNQTIFIADFENNRIMQWKSNATSGQLVAGGNGQGNRLNQLNWPTDVIVDKETNSLIICDHGNQRVMQWSLQSGTQEGKILLEKINCRILVMDDQRCLYVSDALKHEVKRYRIGEKKGTLVAGGNGEGDRLNQLNFPTYLFVDREYSIYVLDYHNHRVMKWEKGATEGIIVAGGEGEENSLNQLTYPSGLFVDLLGTIYVAEENNNRVIRWRKGGIQGEVIVGENGQGKEKNQLNRPFGLSFDQHGHLYISDCWNNRVQRFSLETN